MSVTVGGPTPVRSFAAPLRALVARVLRLEGRRAGEIGVRLTGDEELRDLNRRWRGIDRATDVISFAYDEREPDAARRPVSGDLVVSLERIAEQARRYRVTRGRELTRIVVHGTLHLCGHDHARSGPRRAMRARERAALAGAAGVARRLDAALTKLR